MVEISLIVEGGDISNNINAQTANNTESLRQALNKFFTRLLNRDDISIKLALGGGNKNAVKMFLKNSDETILFVDSDHSNTDEWYKKMEDMNIPNHKKGNIFFMIQEMEAWFLKQLSCLDRWAEKEGYTRKQEGDISQHSVLINKNIEDIKKPSDKLATVLKVYFEKKGKSARYGKLKTAPALLDALNTSDLLPLDKELQRLKNK
ncbi:MAG: hypothetical protein IIW58_07100 [Bacteroidales bacterium]|nr:hypothetical protein [Bacteroidales bacterium]MBQ5891947.1 hypothetical protein [Bacteroidales bacterium]